MVKKASAVQDDAVGDGLCQIWVLCDTHVFAITHLVSVQVCVRRGKRRVRSRGERALLILASSSTGLLSAEQSTEESPSSDAGKQWGAPVVGPPNAAMALSQWWYIYHSTLLGDGQNAEGTVGRNRVNGQSARTVVSQW